MKFCFICGKKTDNLEEGYCEDCYNKKFNLVEIPKEISITQCSKCRRIKQKNNWKDIEDEALIKSIIKVIGNEVKVKIDDNKILVTGSLKGSKVKEEVHDLSIKVKKVLCDDCARKCGNYYESIIQLRGNITEEILDFVYKYIKETFYRSENVKNGLNLYIGNENIASKIADGLKKSYKLKVKKSYKLYTKKEGRDVYRSTFLIRCD